MAAEEKPKSLKSYVDDITRTNELFLAELNQLNETESKDISSLIEDVTLNSVTFQQKLDILRIDFQTDGTSDNKSELSRTTPVRRPADLSGDQNLTNQMKAQLLRNVEIQNRKLQSELMVREKLADLKTLAQQKQLLNEDWSTTHKQSMKLLKLMEQKSATADKKLQSLQQELTKSQEQVKKYKSLYETSLRATPLQTNTPLQSLDLDEFRPKTASRALLTSFRVNDVVRRNECLTEENGDLLREVQRLKRDNGDLLKKAKRSMSDRETIMVKLQTSESLKLELYKRFNKERQKHQNLNRSLTRKASEWIQTKKLIHQLEEEYRWDQVRPISPVEVEQIYALHSQSATPKLLQTQ